MSYMQKEKQSKKTLWILIPIIAVLAIGGYFIWDKNKAKPVVVFNEDITIEYAQEDFDLESYVNQEESEYDKISFEPLSCKNADEKTIKTQVVGSFKAYVYAELEGNCEMFELPYSVSDTTFPVIENVKDITIAQGEEPDFSEFSAQDPIDGRVESYILGDYDNETAGTYPLTFVGEDKHGNKTEEDFTLTVE